tara:strand:- start:1269 stop:2297 length:1029 start_codon:yes stop_codon:yes gene_type:complete
MHYDDMLKSPKGKLRCVDEISLGGNTDSDSSTASVDVYTSNSPRVESVDSAILINKTGICNPNKIPNVFKYVTKMVNEKEKSIGKPIPEKDVSKNVIINKAAEMIGCDTGECVLASVVKKYNINTSASNSAMKPSGPRNSTTWLSNDNTDKVLRGIENEFEEFFWFQTTMMDFESENVKRFLSIDDDKDLKHADEIILKELKNNKTCFGCIINTDKTSNCKNGKCGLHWVSVFIDCRKLHDSPWTIEYFDSVGDPPADEVCKWQEQLKKKLEEFRLSNNDTGGVSCEINDIQHQRANNECGVYCSYFIRARVEGIPFSRFKNRKLPDHVMIKYRTHLFGKDK